MISCDRCHKTFNEVFSLYSIFENEPWVCEECVDEFISDNSMTMKEKMNYLKKHKKEWYEFAHGAGDG